jgi:hypothetical protein
MEEPAGRLLAFCGQSCGRDPQGLDALIPRCTRNCGPLPSITGCANGKGTLCTALVEEVYLLRRCHPHDAAHSGRSPAARRRNGGRNDSCIMHSLHDRCANERSLF